MRWIGAERGGAERHAYLLPRRCTFNHFCIVLLQILQLALGLLSFVIPGFARFTFGIAMPASMEKKGKEQRTIKKACHVSSTRETG